MRGPESAHDLTERTQRAHLAVTEVALEAERSDEVPGTGQVWAGHRREQVVLDLVVEATEDEGRAPTTGDVTGCNDLPSGEACGGISLK
jgi:hypothetical protein